MNKASKEVLHEIIKMLEKENENLKEENELLKQALDTLMYQADVINVKIEGGKYCYIRSDRKPTLKIEEKS